MNPKPHFEQPFGLADNPALRSELSSRFPQFGQMKNGTRVKRSEGATGAQNRLAAELSGTGSPRCSKPLSVIIRPRGVRLIKPCWSRYGS